MSYELNQSQISDVLTNNPVLASLVQSALASNVWPNGNPVCPVAPGWFSSGSPTAIGYAISDATYGSILVACDANGVLHYNVDSPVSPTVQNAPPYQSPATPPGQAPGCPGWSNIGSMNDFLVCLGQGASTLTTLAFLAIGYLVWKEIK